MIYLFKKGRIVTITWSHGGNICKILARPGQIVFDNYKKDIKRLEEDEYIVSTNELGIDWKTEYTVAQLNIKPLPGMLVNVIYLTKSSNYEKKLRKRGILKSPLYNSEEPEGIVNEIIAFKKLIYPFIQPRFASIKKIIEGISPLFELSNGEVIEKGSLKLFYRKTIDYEKYRYNQKERNKQIVARTFNKEVTSVPIFATT